MVKPTKRLATHIFPSHHIGPTAGLFFLACLVPAVLAVFTLPHPVSAADLPPVPPVADETTTTSVENDETVVRDFMVCRHCGNDISLSNFLLNVDSPSALQSWNATLFRTPGVLVQELNNPLGGLFRVVGVKKAHCAKVDHWTDTHTWFPGFAWKVCVCPKCSIHLGWMFEPLASSIPSQIYPTDGGFYALIVNNVLSEDYVNNLLETDWNN